MQDGSWALKCNSSQIVPKAKSTPNPITRLFYLPCKRKYVCIYLFWSHSTSLHMTGFQRLFQCKGETADKGCPILSLWVTLLPQLCSCCCCLSSTLKLALGPNHVNIPKQLQKRRQWLLLAAIKAGNNYMWRSNMKVVSKSTDGSTWVPWVCP